MAAKGVGRSWSAWLCGTMLCTTAWLYSPSVQAQVQAQAAPGIILAKSNHHAQLQAIYDLMSAQPYVYDPQEVDKAGDRAMKLSGDTRIYALWHVLYAYKNDEDEANLIKWRDRILATAHAQRDAALEQMARFMDQAYRNETEDFTAMDDGDWQQALDTADSAVHDIVMLEKVRQLHHDGRWADAIDEGDSLITRLTAEGHATDSLLLVAHQVVSYALVQVGDYDNYLNHSTAMARLAGNNAFFSQKMDVLYDLALEAARENDAPLAEKLQGLHSGYVHKFAITDLMRWDETLCAKVETQVQNYPAVIKCLEQSSVVSRAPTSNLDVQKLEMLVAAYARTGNAVEARKFLAVLDSAPAALNPHRDILFRTAVDAFLLRDDGHPAEAFAKLDAWSAGMADHNEGMRVNAMHGLYQALRKELDRKSAESELLSKQVQLGHWLTAAAGVIALLLGLLAAGAVVWVVRIRRMQFRLKDAHDTAEAANTAKSRFLAVMSHELRTPLNGVLGMAQALQKEDLSLQQKDQIGVLVDSGKTLMALLNDVLDMSSIETGRVELAPVTGSLRQMIERVIHTYAATAREKNLNLHCDIAESASPQMTFDPLRVYQCLSNLVSNALKFTERGSVSILASAERRAAGGFRVRIEVRDTGIGMSAAMIDRMFDPHTSADIGAKAGDAGLGLNISRRLAELMGGSLTATSLEGQGASLVLTFDAGDAASLKPEPTTADAAADLAKPVMQGKKILLVDDHPVNRRVARLFLEPFNFIITEAVDGQEALDADMSKFDLVLMDLNMPRMGGLEACRLFRASESVGGHVPIVALTADAMKDQIDACYAAGMDAHISKPILMDKLVETVTGLLDGSLQPAARTGTAG